MVTELAQLTSVDSQRQIKTPDAAISGALITKESMAAAGGKATVAVQGSSAAAIVPAAVVEAAGYASNHRSVLEEII